MALLDHKLELVNLTNRYVQLLLGNSSLDLEKNIDFHDIKVLQMLVNKTKKL